MKTRPKTGSSTETNEIQRRERTGTLGALLFADPSRRRVSEQEWIAVVQAIAGGDQSALRALYERAHRITFTVILRITGSREAAEELTLDVFYDVWRRASDYDPANGPVLGWILNQARSRAIDRMRYDGRRKRVNPLAPGPFTETHADDQYVVIDRAELARQLTQAIAVLTSDERQAIEAVYFSELSHTEAAAHLGEPLGTIKTRIRSGLGKLRVHFATDKDAS